MSIWHWLVILIVLALPLLALWGVIYSAVRAATRKRDGGKPR